MKFRRAAYFLGWVLVNTGCLSANDSREEAIDLGDERAIRTSGTIIGAPQTEDRSAWWTWQAPDSQWVTFDVESNEGSFRIYAYKTGRGGDPVASSSPPLVFQAKKEVRYDIRVRERTLEDGADFDLLIDVPTSPSNNHFANRTVLEAITSQELEGTLRGTSLEEGVEPSWLTIDVGSVWWSWTAPQTGRARLWSQQGSSDFHIFSGTEPTALEPVSLRAFHEESIVVFDAIEGVTYQLSLRGYLRDLASLDYLVSLESHPYPASNHYGNRIDLGSSKTFQDVQTNVGATAEATDAENGGKEIWWEWTAPENLGVLLTSNLVGQEDPGFLITVFDGVPDGDLSPIASADAPLQFTAKQGTTYSIAVDTVKADAAEGLVSLAGETISPPLNDDFANRIDLGAERYLEFATSNFGASTEEGEPDLSEIPHRHSVWYAWTAPASTLVEIHTSDPALIARAYVGEQLSELIAIETTPQFPFRNHAYHFQAKQGVHYALAFDSSSQGMDDSEIKLSLAGQPDNDIVGNPEPISGAPLSIAQDLSGATIQILEPKHRLTFFDSREAFRSVWYLWSTSEPGSYEFSVSGNARPLVAIYEGRLGLLDIVGSPVPLAGDQDRLDVFTFNAKADVLYQVVIASLDESGRGEFRLNARRDDVANDGFSSWQDTHFKGQPDLAKPTADPDGDGLTNLIEYALGSHPLHPSLPGLSIDSEGSVTFLRPRKNGLIYQYESSANLRTWERMRLVEDYTLSINPAPDQDFEWVTLDLSDPTEEAYIRLSVEQP